MSESFQVLALKLNEFHFENFDFNSDQQAIDVEILTTNRIIKKEVIDSADLIEQIAKVLIVMGERVDLNQRNSQQLYLQLNSNLQKMAQMLNLDVNEINTDLIMEQDPMISKLPE